uniref:NADH-ubiquinone oxidoreductase chain 1 n=1 Tax=Schizocephala bicornis TaxID=444990 RepID=A0A343UN78_9NEOP|nr:NADH dehydrogenase subunit 1 [Schizocephala bicornis]AVE15728.1 NADH dehydrogenase subunit 1 [Schizocephala bicornis]
MMGNEIYMCVLVMLVLMIFILISVAFFTLLERSVLGYIHLRKGPNKVSYVGILQPISDAVKLFCKEHMNPSNSNYLLYYMCPIVSLFLSLMLWILMPYEEGLITFNLGLFFFMVCTSMGVYTVMLGGWSSNSNYALMGGLRAVAQTISYEVSLMLIMLSFVFLVKGYSLFNFMYYQLNIWLMFLCFPLCNVWFTSCLAETNRSPFDFAEGESELVSGFNVEYGGGGFALIFLSEYSSILFMSVLMTIIFLGSNMHSLMFYLKVVFIGFLFIWIRGTLPRYRYDKLMYLAWSSFLPLSLNFLLFYMGMLIIF